MFITVNVLTIQRYMAICHPFFSSQHKLSSRSRAIKSIFGIWLAALFCAYPIAITVDLQKKPALRCVVENDPAFFSMEIIWNTLFFSSMLVLGIMYALIGFKIKKSSKKIRSNNESADHSKQRAPKMIS